MNNLNKKNKKNRGPSRQAGMTYVELIVVLSIFATMSSIVLFNYDKFQSKVDIKNLANDIALKVVEAQKASLSGKQLPDKLILPSWKPAYGLYFSTVSNTNVDNKNFIYFADFSDIDRINNNIYDDNSCSVSDDDKECLDKINITKGNYISNLDIFYQDNPTVPASFQNLTLTFTRPNSGVIITSNGIQILNVFYVQITITSPSLVTSKIKVYASGRIQIN